jgi:uncharacterized protein (DUF1330 family)
MSKVYVVIQFDLANQEMFSKYVKSALSTITGAGGQVLIAAENLNVLEGAMASTRTTVIEFPSKDAAIGWYNSNEYKQIKSLRIDATKNSSLVILDGWKKST